MRRKVLVSLAYVVCMIISISIMYVSDYYKGDSVAYEIYEQNNDSLEFVGNNNEIGFIIYTGGKVEEKAYVRLAKLLNDSGYNSIVVDFPLNIGFLGINKADDIIEKYSDVESWIIIGHSLGGTVGSIYSLEKNDKVDGLVFLASYPVEDLTDVNIETLSIYGSNDGILNKERNELAKDSFTDEHVEVIIEGGNHAGFANYGEQAGDGENLIGYEQQQEIAVDNIINWTFENIIN